jgi:hypothetical protein
MTAADIYPAFRAAGPADFDQFLAPHCERLRAFYRSAAGAGHAVLLAIC